ncbi:MAG: tRNA (adenine(22)-N(1))-methyltransferase TrmK [Thermoactinomycetaceae bacterium]|nr:tRNA (adenine(22)-N(1))-methyltransferase TrmK [Bacillota bacterium]MBO2531418.1 tRNA (adenine(22)-N(1))-methyltransferase TrmK [Thermoactinomycetaceae bacterium]
MSLSPSPSRDVKCSERLQAVARWVPAGTTVADIGADHAHLLIHLVLRKRIEKGIAGELNKGPFENARSQVRRWGLSDRIEVRRGDGLSVLKEGEADVIVIAGMGGPLIAKILDQGREKLSGAFRLVLQPNTGGERVRRWLRQNGWAPVGETLVEEGGTLYEIIAAERGEDEALYRQPPASEEQLLLLGPLLWKEKHPLLIKKWLQELAARERILERVRAGRTEEAARRAAQLEEEIAQWRRLRKWLCEENP